MSTNTLDTMSRITDALGLRRRATTNGADSAGVGNFNYGNPTEAAVRTAEASSPLFGPFRAIYRPSDTSTHRSGSNRVYETASRAPGTSNTSNRHDQSFTRSHRDLACSSTFSIRDREPNYRPGGSYRSSREEFSSRELGVSNLHHQLSDYVDANHNSRDSLRSSSNLDIGPIGYSTGESGISYRTVTVRPSSSRHRSIDYYDPPSRQGNMYDGSSRPRASSRPYRFNDLDSDSD